MGCKLTRKDEIPLKHILSKLRKAVDDFHMINEGDKIAVALSGGKDSLTLFLALKNLQIFYPKHFELMALTIDPGSNVFDTTKLEEFCKEHSIEYVIEKTDIKEIVFDIRKEKNPCSLCANMRRGALNSVAKAHGCNKIALGHHKDDVIETFFLSLCYEGHINTFSPVTYLERADITTIRPMIYLEEKEIKQFAKNNDLPVMQKNCEMDGNSKREYMKNLSNTLSKDIPKFKESIFGAIMRSHIPGWDEHTKGESNEE